MFPHIHRRIQQAVAGKHKHKQTTGSRGSSRTMSASLVLLVPDRPVVAVFRTVFWMTTTIRLDRTHARDTGREQALRFPGRTQGTQGRDAGQGGARGAGAARGGPRPGNAPVPRNAPGRSCPPDNLSKLVPGHMIKLHMIAIPRNHSAANPIMLT